MVSDHVLWNLPHVVKADLDDSLSLAKGANHDRVVEDVGKFLIRDRPDLTGVQVSPLVLRTVGDRNVALRRVQEGGILITVTTLSISGVSLIAVCFALLEGFPFV